MQLRRPIVFPMGWLNSHSADTAPPCCRWCGSGLVLSTDTGELDELVCWTCASCDLTES